MALKTYYIGSTGPFYYDDTEQQPDGSALQQAFRTEGDVEANNIVTEGLSENVRLVVSDASKKLAEVEDLTVFINSGIGLTAVNNGDGSVTLKRQQAVAKIVNTDSPYTAAGTRTVLIDATSGDITVNLPTVVDNNGLEYIFKRIDSSANTVTIDGNGTEVIEDTETKTLLSGDAMYIISDATQWWII